MDRWRRTAGLGLGPLVALSLLFLPLPSLSPVAHRLASIVALVVIFWLTEAIPIPVTALLGAALAVVFGVASAKSVLAAFGDPIIFLFIGSFMLARAMQVHGIDRRIAFSLLSHPWVGASTYRTLWALGLTACLLSMWISNTACVAMLFPVALAIARTTGELLHANDDDAEAPRLRYTTGLLLMLAYAGSVGGVATPVGTPPNLIGLALIEQGLGVRIGFVQWMLFGVPVALALLAVVYGVIVLMFPPELRAVPGQLMRMRQARGALGPMTAGERNSLIAFGLAVALWVVPGLLGLALGAVHPTVRLLGERLPEGIVALLAACLLFVLPTDWAKREMTLRWDQAVRIDWGTVLLFGGGIALGRMMFDTGLAEAIGRGLLGALGLHSPVAITGAAAAIASVISETCSNTASANMVVPVMLSVAESVEAPGLFVAVAATLGASMGFMLPISTPPNAIVYGSRAVRITDMIRAGLLLDLIGFFVIWAACAWLVPLALSW
ncbi:MAG: DASS family sodium-coupled anion symporter [Candidatus Omnitrophica bacterium]|nr:DASS family sodium-coupled anion symporter [Candidatus Omnitrophota bacterium]